MDLAALDGDKINPMIGDHVHKTKSSEELGYLNRVTEWAKAARLVRVVGGKLVPVKKNAALADEPLRLVVELKRNSDEVDELGYADWSQGTAELTGLGRYALSSVYRIP
jgi:hypothetical protein